MNLRKMLIQNLILLSFPSLVGAVDSTFDTIHGKNFQDQAFVRENMGEMNQLAKNVQRLQLFGTPSPPKKTTTFSIVGFNPLIADAGLDDSQLMSIRKKLQRFLPNRSKARVLDFHQGSRCIDRINSISIHGHFDRFTVGCKIML